MVVADVRLSHGVRIVYLNPFRWLFCRFSHSPIDFPFFNDLLSLWNELVTVRLDNIADVLAVLGVKLTE